MTLGNLLSQMGMAPHQLTDRYSHGDYGPPPHDTQTFYSYEPAHSSHGHVGTSKHHHGGGGHKSNAAMSALTLLSFLFFLHILQQCLRDHMTQMSQTPMMIMTAGREGEEPISKSSAINKIDKAGVTDIESKHAENDLNRKRKVNNDNHHSKHNFNEESPTKNALTKVKTAEYIPTGKPQKYRNVYTNFGNRSSPFKGFVSAMDENYTKNSYRESIKD